MMPMEATFTGRRNMPGLVMGKLSTTPQPVLSETTRTIAAADTASPSSPSLLAPSSSGPSAPFTVTSPEPQSGRVPAPVSPPCLLETRMWRCEALPHPKGTPIHKHS